ncbi:MAG: hypothetical protein UV79_C0008G0010 [candidate division TM6 bacterium GW2011_GWF2_43_17]|nr:MAG: hypothetical protein UV79_C0008G0010 [candidate division TM6 bacterium GW2011_GWF2_43_17]HAU30102.1 hypothetical protein [Candidatus Dependentiae bacterium]
MKRRIALFALALLMQTNTTRPLGSVASYVLNTAINSDAVKNLAAPCATGLGIFAGASFLLKQTSTLGRENRLLFSSLAGLGAIHLLTQGNWKNELQSLKKDFQKEFRLLNAVIEANQKENNENFEKLNNGMEQTINNTQLNNNLLQQIIEILQKQQNNQYN